MAAPTKSWVVLPTTIGSTPIPIVSFTDETEANKAAIKAAISTGAQYIVLESVSYVDPDILPAVVTAMVKPIV